MHVYIYDSFVNEKKNNNIVAKIETRITDLGLSGKIIRLNVVNSIFDAIENEIKKGAKTIIVVGNNHIFNLAINSIINLKTVSFHGYKVPLGFIPVGKKGNEIADFLGINYNVDACDTLSARRIKSVGLGQINNNYFFAQAEIPTTNTVIEIDKNFSIEISESGKIYVVNLPVFVDLPKEIVIGEGLKLLINTKGSSNKYLPLDLKKSKKSIFSFNKLQLINPKDPIVLDNSVEIKTPVDVKFSSKKIDIIVGKNRIF